MLTDTRLKVVLPTLAALLLLLVTLSPLAAWARPAETAGAPAGLPALMVTASLSLARSLELTPANAAPAAQPGDQPRAGYELFLPLLLREAGVAPAGRAPARCG